MTRNGMSKKVNQSSGDNVTRHHINHKDRFFMKPSSS